MVGGSAREAKNGDGAKGGKAVPDINLIFKIAGVGYDLVVNMVLSKPVRKSRPRC